MRVLVLIFGYLFYGLLATHFGLNSLIEGENLKASMTAMNWLFPYCLILDIVKKA